jgi:hypothetical protein
MAFKPPHPPGYYPTHHEHLPIQAAKDLANFPIKEAGIRVSTVHHPGSDHRGVILKWYNMLSVLEVPSSPLLSHRATKVKAVKSFACSTIQDYVDNHAVGPYPFPKWEKGQEAHLQLCHRAMVAKSVTSANWTSSEPNQRETST